MIISKKFDALSETFYLAEFETIPQTGFREGFIVMNAISSFIVSDFEPKASPLENFEKINKLGILAINFEISKVAEAKDKEMSDDEKANRLFPAIPIYATENQLRSLHCVLGGFISRTSVESYTPTNLSASSGRIIEGGMATRIHQEIEQLFRDLSAKHPEKTKLGFSK